jgi:hypothetical protein
LTIQARALRDRGAMKAADPQAELLSRLSAGLLSPADIGPGLSLLLAMAIELVSAFGPTVLSNYAERMDDGYERLGLQQHCGRHDEAIQPKKPGKKHSAYGHDSTRFDEMRERKSDITPVKSWCETEKLCPISRVVRSSAAKPGSNKKIRAARSPAIGLGPRSLPNYITPRSHLTLFELQEWLGHRSPESTRHYTRIGPTKLAKSYEDAGYFARNLQAVEVLIDQDAIRSGTAASEPWRYYDLGHGYCTYDFFDQCPHRMACARCGFYEPKASAKAQALEGKANLLRLRQEIPLNDAELRAVEEGIAAHVELVAKLGNVPAPDRRSPMQVETDLGR